MKAIGMRHRPAFSRFRDLSFDSVNVEYQVHTVQTDGEATVDDILLVARQREIGALAFTEHVRIDTAWFPDFVSDVRQRSTNFPDINVYVGCETKALDNNGTLDVSSSILEACDIVLGSVHRFPDGEGGYANFAAFSPEEFAETEFRLAIGMVQHAPIDVLAHPGGMYERRNGNFPPEYFRALMVACLDREIAIEINSSYLVDFPHYLTLCDEINPFVSIGSDAHRLQELGGCRDMLRQRGIGKQ